MDLTVQIIIFFVVITVVIWISIWYYYTPKNISNFKVMYSFEDYLKGFKENFLSLTKLNDVKQEGSIVFNNDAKYIKKNLNLLDNQKLYKLYTTENINKNHPKIEIVPKTYANQKVFHKALYKTFRNKCVILNFFSHGCLPEWRNLIFTLRQLKLDDLVVAFPLDKLALDGIKQENIKYDLSIMKKDNVESVTFGKKDFNKITCNKVLAIEKMLKAGYFVFYLDADIIVKKNFVEHYFTLPPKDCWMQNDHNNFKKTAIATDKHGEVKYNHCSGVMFIAPTAYMIKIMQKAYPEILKVKTGGLTDQKVLNKLIEYKRIGTLCPYLYPNGWRYFSSKKYKGQYVLLHNNWLKGSDKKIRRLKQHNLWYI